MFTNAMNPGCGCCGGGGGGGTGGTIPYPGCQCSVPPTLKMTSQNTTCQNGTYQNATIQYGPPPSAFGTTLGIPCGWFSTQSFLDPVANAYFYYYFGCNGNQFYLKQYYATSPYGSPYQGPVIYDWFTGTGNTCSPFLLTVAGGDTYNYLQGPPQGCADRAGNSLVMLKIDGTSMIQNRVPGC